MSVTTPATPIAATDLSLTRLHLMRAGYLFMGVGLALVKWPLLSQAEALPLYEGVTLCLLTAVSLLAFLGLLHPVKLLPLLLFESTWKLLWLSLVALPEASAGDLDAATTEIVVSCSLVVVVLAVTPWRYVWRNYIRANADRGDDRDPTHAPGVRHRSTEHCSRKLLHIVQVVAYGLPELSSSHREG